MYRMVKMDDKMFRDADAGDPYAGLAVAYIYHQGKNVEQDSVKAIEWYVKAAEKGCSRAKWELAKIYKYGTIADKDDALFIKYLRKAADAGTPEAKVEVALQYMSGGILPNDNGLAYRWMKSAAEQKLPMAQFLVGYMLGHGIGTEEDKAESEMWYSKVGLYGDAELFYQIGMDFEFGFFAVTPDLFEAGRWYKMGADMGHEKCYLCWQAVLQALGGGKKDTLKEREERMSHTPVAMEQHARDLALMAADYELDQGDYDKAFENYNRAAELGNPVAMFTLALMYHDGVYVKRSDRISLELMSKASLAGSEDAQYMMGTLYERGRGYRKDKDEAIKYYTMAAANGYLAAFYKLSQFMDHPEIYVRNNSAIIVR
jgi:uncharacterized protein